MYECIYSKIDLDVIGVIPENNTFTSMILKFNETLGPWTLDFILTDVWGAASLWRPTLKFCDCNRKGGCTAPSVESLTGQTQNTGN